MPGRERSERRPAQAGALCRGFALRLVTYNIHKGIGGVDRRYELDRVIEVLRSCEPDIVFLQEVDEGAPRSLGHRQVDEIGEKLGFAHRLFAPNVRLRQGHYGNALLSRYALDGHANVDLTIPFKKRRSALHARCTLRDEDGHVLRLWLFNVHLGLSGLERRAQIRKLLAWIERRQLPHNLGVIVAGDFNDVFNRLGPRLLHPRGFKGSGPLMTFPAARPFRSLDKAFIRGALRIESCHTVHTKLARIASDHLPVLCALKGDMSQISS